MGGFPALIRVDRVAYHYGSVRTTPIDLAVFSDGTVRFGLSRVALDHLLTELKIEGVPNSFLVMKAIMYLRTPRRIKSRCLAIGLRGNWHAIVYFLGRLPDPGQESVGMQALVDYAAEPVGIAVVGAEALSAVGTIRRRQAAAVEARNLWHRMISLGTTAHIPQTDPRLRELFGWILKRALAAEIGLSYGIGPGVERESTSGRSRMVSIDAETVQVLRVHRARQEGPFRRGEGR